MRLHSLRATAFGPFAGTVEVDFDDLGAAGLFLLTGATGAGKTSVLDAVCFGLYGEVPGDRGTARSLRSDHAAPDVEPRVELVLSVGERRLRLSRSPSWERPKRRGEGTRRIQASVVAEEWREGRWSAVSTRLDETGHLVGELLGMTCTQFTQVAMLPQGRFQAFLRASSADRHALLQRLFRTSRFDAVERWLGEQRQQARRDAASAHDACVSVLDRLCEAVSVELPAGWEPPTTPAALGLLVDDQRLPRWLQGLQQGLVREGEELGERLQEADVVLEEAGRTREAAGATEELRAQGQDARTRLADCEAGAEAVEALAARLARHDAALPLLPVARRVTQATADHQRARSTADAGRARVAAALGWDEVTLERLREARAETERRHGLAESWRPQERELERDRRAAAAEAARAEGLRPVLADVDRQLVATERATREAAQERATLHDVHERLRSHAEAAEREEAALVAAREHEQVVELLDAAVAQHQELTAESLARKEHYLDLRERRIAGMAAELATGLAVGCSCPVCGSLDHPAPAVTRHRVAPDDEDAARAAHESTEVMRQAAGETVSGLRSRASALAAAAGGLAVAERERRHHDALVARDRAESERDRLLLLEHELTGLQEERTRLLAEQARLRAELAAAEAGATELADRAERLAHRLAELLAGATATPATTVSALLDALDVERGLLDEVAEHLRAEAATHDALAQAEATAAESLAPAGFADVAACLGAALDADEEHRTREQVTAWHRRRDHALGVLDRPEVLAALDAPPVDLASLREAERRARDVRDLHLAASRACATRAARCAELGALLDERLAAWAPLRERHEQLASLTALVDGTSPDNALRMRLSGYVLAERLRQVVAAADVRLASMTHERFSLRQTDEKGAGERRGGLSLRVRDDWSGTVRDPVTLSGGETFVVSLALALGLADVVSQEAGGTTIETLFVDEGFGALDDATLDAVMDVLDGLRDGGRVVGLVSHVAELRARVPAQLEVRLGREGSTLGPVRQHA